MVYEYIIMTDDLKIVEDCMAVFLIEFSEEVEL